MASLFLPWWRGVANYIVRVFADGVPRHYDNHAVEPHSRVPLFQSAATHVRTFARGCLNLSRMESDGE